MVDTYDALSALDVSSISSGSGEGDEHQEQVIGGRNISISSGTYDFESSTSTYDYLIAASEKLSLLGNVVFNSGTSESTLIMMSAKSIDIGLSTDISFSGHELGIGSFDSLNVENVSLTAKRWSSLRSFR